MAGSKLPLAPGDVRGRQMGHYEVLCRLSTGGMAEILLATRRGLAGFHKPVVLKKILPDIQGQEEFVQMFLDEARVTADFNHPNIAQVFDLDVAEDELFLAMEFVPGATLLEVARACRATHEPMPMGFALAAVRDTALALHYAHTFTDTLGQPSPVIHRDVAEKNIMVTYEGVTKLLDFGIAKHLAGASRTQVGMVKGTSGYMSPEQILGEPLDARSDLFSLGVVLHECLTGMRLFPGKAPAAVVDAVLRGPIPEPSRTNKAIPPELDAIVLKALARKRQDRYATTLEFARELERAMGSLIWLPEQSGELMRRLFAERREQTRQLLASGRTSTGEVKLAQLFADKDAPTSSPSSPHPPAISTPGFPVPPAAVSEETDVISYSVVTKPPAPLASERRTVSTPSTPAVPPPPRTRLARAETESSKTPARPRTAIRADALPVGQEARELDSRTAVIRPPRSPPTREQPQPVTSDATVPRYNPARQARRPTPSLSHLDAVEQPPRALEPAPEPPAPEEQPLSEQTVPPDETTVPHLRSPLAQPRQVEPEDGPELPTAPFMAPPPSLARPTRREPEDDSTGPLIAPGHPSPEPARSPRGVRVAVLLVLLLLAGAAILIVLRLDGGLLSSRLFPSPAEVSAPVAPSAGVAPPAPTPQVQAQQTESGNVPLEAETPASVATIAAPPPTEMAAASEDSPEAKNEPPQPAKRGKGVAASRRKRKAPETSMDVETSPELVMNPNEAERAWQALERERSGTAEPSGEKGSLTLTTDQYAKVYLGSRLLGETPFFRMPLPPGKHTLRLVVPEGKPLKLPVEIKAGEVTSLRVSLAKLTRE